MSASSKSGGSGTSGAKGAFGTPSDAKKKSEAIRKQQQQDERRRRITLLVVLAVVIIGIGVAIALVVAQSSDDSSDGGNVTPPLGASATSVQVGDPNAPVLMDLYQDYMCPACGQFEDLSGPTVNELIDEGTIRVNYHPLSFLDRLSNGTRYSTRSASAAGCSADQGVFREYNELLFANQPAENTPGLSDDELIELGSQAGTDAPAFETCVRELTYEDWVESLTDESFDDGVTGTPTVRVDGEQVEDLSPAGIQAAVDAALGASDGSAGNGQSGDG